MKVYSQHGHIHLTDISRHSRQVDTVRLVLKAGRVMSMGGDGYDSRLINFDVLIR